MSIYRPLHLFLCFAALLSGASFAQAKSSPEGIWEHMADASIQARIHEKRPKKFKAIRIHQERLQNALSKAPKEHRSDKSKATVMSLPMPDGSFEDFAVETIEVMAPGLGAQFPEIKTYIGRGIDDPAASARIDCSPKGFHAQILSPKGAVYIDPMNPGDLESAISYYKKDNQKSSSGFQCYLEHSAPQARKAEELATAARSGSQLRTYRIACAATGEYTQFHGGTVADGLAAIVTAINRVSGIYEVELSIRLQLVANNNLLIYTNSGSDPYTNSNTSALLGENQSNIDSVIGSNNYDIGHVFSTEDGGLAALGSAGINGSKAEGATGLTNPIGDSFYVDFVAHEIGHQFGGDHTFNGDSSNCAGGNRNAATAYEPGSGSTIQAYAGICSNDNLQFSSDPYFHSVSLDQMLTHVDDTIPSVGTRTATGNAIPTVSAGNDYTIPARTPFVLTASGSDADGNGTLTYNWEERDLGPQQDVNAGDNGSSPIFRSWSPDADPSRTFPRLSDLVNNTTVIGETLPTTTRNMQLRATVRDNASGGGGVNTDDMTLSVIDTGSAFAVTSPNTAVNWSAFSNQTITWNVAGTTSNGINTSQVSILLSTDGGLSYPTTILASTPNDGSASISIPNSQTNQARIRVQAVDNVFFDISNQNFTISAPVFGFSLDPSPSEQSICAPQDAVYTVDVLAIAGFSDPVTLSSVGQPSGSTVSFSPNPVSPGSSGTMTLSNTGAVSSGDYSIEIQGTSGAFNSSIFVDLALSNGTPTAVNLLSPAQGSTGVSATPTFSWSSVAEPVTYRLEVDDDPNFTSLTYSAVTEETSDSISTALELDRPYYWRVISLNTCDETSTDYAYFTTDATPANICSSPDLAIPDGNTSGVTDTINTSNAGTLTDLNLSIDITHTWIGDLTVELTHVNTGTSAILIARPGLPALGDFGSDAANIDIILDDEASLTVEDNTPYTSGNSYIPNNPLSEFDGESLAGTWLLTVSDAVNQDSGTLVSWCLIPTVSNTGDTYPRLSLSDATVAEDAGSVNVPYSLTSTSDSTITINYATANGSALSGSDYTATSDTLVINTSTTSGNISIPILTDEVVEADESFTLSFGSASNVIVEDNQANITITDVSSPILLWLDGFGLDLNDLDSDTDKDGLSALVEYSFNLDPTQSAQIYYDPLAPVGINGPVGLPKVDLTDAGANSRLQIIYPRRKSSGGSGLSYTASFNGDLNTTWTPKAPDNIESIDAEWEEVTVNDSVTTSSAVDGKRFGRVEVTTESVD